MQRYAYSFMVGARIEKVQDLKGKRVMLPLPRALLTQAFNNYLVANGMKVDDVDQVFDGSSSNRFAAMAANVAAGAYLNAPFDIKAAEGGYRKLFDLGEFYPEAGAALFIARKDWLGYRYATDPHCDLAEQLTFYGVSGRDGAARKFNLDFYCKAFGIESPKAQGVTGMDVSDLVAQGRHKEIADYCLRDVRATVLLEDLRGAMPFLCRMSDSQCTVETGITPSPNSTTSWPFKSSSVRGSPRSFRYSGEA